MLRRQLGRAGVYAGRRHIATLMRRMGIEALAPQPGTSKAQPGHKIYPYLLRKLAIARADIADYLHWYNTDRAHSSLDDVTPEQAYLNLQPQLAKAA